MVFHCFLFLSRMANSTLTTLAVINATLADDNSTMSNVTTSRPIPRTPPPVGYYGDIRIQLWKILPPMIMTWGITGNILSIIILFRLARKASITSTTIYLVTLAISDTVILLCGPLRNWIKFTWEKDVRYYSDSSCKAQLYFTYLSIHFSSWLLVAITMERVASVVFPHKVRVGCTPRNATVVIFVMLFILGGLGLVHPIIQGLESARGSIKCAPTTIEYTKFRDDVYVWMDFFLSFGFPFLFLVIGNAIIIYRLNKSRLQQKKMNVSRGDGKKSGRDMRSLSILLVALSAIFLLTMTPVNVFAIVYPYKFEALLKIKDPYEQWYAYHFLLYQHAIVNIVGYTNASFNFIMYVLTGTKFRREFLDMLKIMPLWRRIRPKGNRSSASDTKQTSVSASDMSSKQSHSTVTSNTTKSNDVQNNKAAGNANPLVEDTEMTGKEVTDSNCDTDDKIEEQKSEEMTQM